MDLNSKLNTLSELSRLKLADLLTNIGGLKDLVIEQSLIRTLDKICGAKWLKLYDVEKMYKLEDNMVLKSAHKIVFVISSNLIQFKRVINILETNNINDINAEPPEVTKYHIILIPTKLNTLNMLLEESGLCGLVDIHSFMWQFIYLDEGIISLEYPNIFLEIYVNKNWSLLSSIGKSLYFLFDVVGKPKVTITIGPQAENTLEHVEFFEKHLGDSDKTNSDFGAVLIMDRSIDYVSALLTNETYTGLLGEAFRINGGVVERRFPEKESSDSSSEASSSSESKSIFTIDTLNDSIYSEIKYQHISQVSFILGKYVKDLKLEGQTAQDMDLTEIKNFVQTKLQSVTAMSKNLTYHLQASEKIISDLGHKFETLTYIERSFLENADKSRSITRIEDYIMMENHLRSLRLICLISLTQKLSSDEYKSLKLQYLQQHGYMLLFVFQDLLNCGLMLQPQKLSVLSLPSIGPKKDFYSIASKLKLIPLKPEEVNVRSPKCPSYVFGGGYIPVVAQILSFLIQAQSLGDIKSKVDLLGGTIKSENLDKPFPLVQRTVLVFVIGGLTYAEIAACKLVEKIVGCKIVLASNCLITGNDLLEQLL